MNNIKNEIKNRVGLNISEKDAELFDCYITFLCDENKLYNLTGHKTKEDILENLIIDSLFVFKSPVVLANKNILDIGSGAGIPGIPIKIVEKSARVILLESNQKKCVFMRRFIENNGLKNVKVICERAESLAKTNEFSGKFDIVTAKALASVKASLKYAGSFLKSGGFFITYKGKKFFNEIKEAELVIKKLNFVLKSVYEVESTDKKIAVFEKM